MNRYLLQYFNGGVIIEIVSRKNLIPFCVESILYYRAFSRVRFIQLEKRKRLTQKGSCVQ